jgi:hypothetical protein
MSMNAFYEHHKNSIRFQYRCFDRILLNGLIQPFQQEPRVVGFFGSYRDLYPVSRDVLRDIATQFQNWTVNRSKKWGAPILDAPDGRRDEFVQPYFKAAKPDQVVCILKAREPPRILTAIGTKKENRWHLELKQRWVVQYNFYINDAEWGRIFVRICPYLPFSARVCLNQHHWIANRLLQRGVRFQQSTNAFTSCADPAVLQEIADSRNLVFEIGHKMDQVFQALIDRSRSRLDLKTIKTILGYQRRPRYRKRKNWVTEWDVTVERPAYDLTIFKLHCGKLTLKIYTKGERVLRLEAVLHNTEELQCGRSRDRFPRLVTELKGILERFMNALSLIDQCFISDETLEQLPKPSLVGKAKVGGIDFNKERMRCAGQAVLALAASSGTFTASRLSNQVCSATGQTFSQYGPRHAAYDLKKLRAKNMIQRVGRSRRYEATPSGLKAIAALVTLRYHIIKPLLASMMNRTPSRGAQNPTPLDHCYASLRTHMQDLLLQLGVAA